MQRDIGSMQVQFRIYVEGGFYDEFAINAYDDWCLVNTDLLSCRFQTIDDPIDGKEKAVTAVIKLREYDYTITMLVPVHQSDQWEVSTISENYAVGFYCILGAD